MKNPLPTLALVTVPLLFAFHTGTPVQKPRASPAATATYNKDGLKMEVHYGRPYKKAG